MKKILEKIGDEIMGYMILLVPFVVLAFCVIASGLIIILAKAFIELL